MSNLVTPKYLSAEGIYPATPMRFAQTACAAGSCRDREERRRHTENRRIFQAPSTL
jgi:hypothetical protein